MRYLHSLPFHYRSGAMRTELGDQQYSDGVSAFGKGKPEAFAVGRGECAGGFPVLSASSSCGSAALVVGLRWCPRNYMGVSPLGKGELVAVGQGVGGRARGLASVSVL